MLAGVCWGIILLSSILPLSTSAYILNFYSSVAYTSQPAAFGRPFPSDSAQGLPFNIFLPPSDLKWDLCDISNVIDSNGNGGTGNDIDNGHGNDIDNGTGNDTETETDTTNSTMRTLEGATFDRDRYGIHRKSIALVITRGGCTFYTKAQNALLLNDYYHQQSMPNSNNNNFDIRTRSRSILEDPPAQIDLLVVVNSQHERRADYTFEMGKNVSEAFVDMSLISIGYFSGAHLIRDMVNHEDKIDEQPSSSRFLTHASFLPLDSPQRTGREWLFPVSIDGLPPRSSIRMRLVLIGAFVTLIFIFARMLMYCFAQYHEFGFRRNGRGWIVGLTFTRIDRAAGAANARNWLGISSWLPVTLSKDQVHGLPTVRFAVDNLDDVIGKYRGGDGDGRARGRKDDDNERKSTGIDSAEVTEVAQASNDTNHSLELTEEEVVVEAEITEGGGKTGDMHDSKEDNSATNFNDVVIDNEIDIDIANSNDVKSASIQKKDSDFVRAAFNSCVMCSICICDFDHGEELRLLPECGHVFHTECILPWLTEKRNTCPLCQQKVNKEEVDEIEEQPVPGGIEANANSNDEANSNVPHRNRDVEQGMGIIRPDNRFGRLLSILN